MIAYILRPSCEILAVFVSSTTYVRYSMLANQKPYSIQDSTTTKKDVTRKESTPASNHFDIKGHNFNTHAKFIFMEQPNQTNLDKLTL